MALDLENEFPGWHDWPVQGDETVSDLQKQLREERRLNVQLMMALEAVPVAAMHTRWGARWWRDVAMPAVKSSQKMVIRWYVTQSIFRERREEVLMAAWSRRNVSTLESLLKDVEL